MINEELNALQESCKTAIESISCVVAKIQDAEEKILNTTVTAPKPLLDLHLKFHGDTVERKVKEVVMKTDHRSVGAVAVGDGGEGKPVTVCAVAWKRDVRKKYPDGVLFKALGAEANNSTVVNCIADMVQMVTDVEIAGKVREMENLGEAVARASMSFREKRVLFIFDDV